jgi:hypothetical protein
VEAGASVACACGRSWDTGRLPADDLDGVRRLVRRARSRRLVFVLNLLLVTGLLVLVGRSSPALALLLTAFVWWRFCRPSGAGAGSPSARRRLPTWQLPLSAATRSPGGRPVNSRRSGADKPPRPHAGSAPLQRCRPRSLPPSRAPARLSHPPISRT